MISFHKFIKYCFSNFHVKLFFYRLCTSIVGILVVWKLNAKIDRGCVVACSAATVSGNVELRDYLPENACKRLEHWQGYG